MKSGIIIDILLFAYGIYLMFVNHEAIGISIILYVLLNFLEKNLGGKK